MWRDGMPMGEQVSSTPWVDSGAHQPPCCSNNHAYEQVVGRDVCICRWGWARPFQDWLVQAAHCSKWGPVPPTPAHLRNLPSLHTLEVWACGETAASPVVTGMASTSWWHQWACPLVFMAQVVPPRPSEVNLYNDTDDSGALELPPGSVGSLAVGPQLPCCKYTRGVPWGEEAPWWRSDTSGHGSIH